MLSQGNDFLLLQNAGEQLKRMSVKWKLLMWLQMVAMMGWLLHVCGTFFFKFILFIQKGKEKRDRFCPLIHSSGIYKHLGLGLAKITSLKFCMGFLHGGKDSGP